MWKTTTYTIWGHMKQRCSNKANPRWCDYGGRGITVCERWRDSFENFLTDMGARPSLNHSLDRVNNDGPYSPENCRWATRKEQAINKREDYWLRVARLVALSLGHTVESFDKLLILKLSDREMSRHIGATFKP